MDKINVFFCSHSEYQFASIKIMDNDIKQYSCNLCGHEASHKNTLTKHKLIVHAGVKFPCGQCNHQATLKENLAEHKRTVIEGVKYACRQCNH